MTAKEKAEQLVSKFMANIIFSIKQNIHASTVEAAKNCASVSVDEILVASLLHFDENSVYVSFWQQVKSEIKKL
jgi:hypothetical protein